MCYRNIINCSNTHITSNLTFTEDGSVTVKVYFTQTSHLAGKVCHMNPFPRIESRLGLFHLGASWGIHL